MATIGATTKLAGAIIVALALVVAGAAGQAPAAAPGPETPTVGVPGPSGGEDCFSYLVNMSDCLTYVEEGSNQTTPDKGCCPELAGLVESHPLCLCQLLGSNTSDTFGIQINLKKALNLPTVCAVETPPVSFCSAVGYPVGAPTSSEAPTPTGGGGGGLSPEAGNNGNGASCIGKTFSQFLGLAIAFLTTLAL